MYKYKFSIIVVTYHQKVILKKILESLELSSFKDFEVIVCDDGGRLSLIDLLNKEWSFPVKYYWHKKGGFENARCRNAGAKLAEGEYVLIVDGDTLFGEDTLRSYVPHLDGETLLWGLRYIINPVVVDKKITSQSHIDSFVVAPDFRGEDAKNVFSGANFVVPIEKYKQVWWNENIKYYGYDDYEFFERWIYGHHFPAAHIPTSIAYHLEHPAKPGDPLAWDILQDTRRKLGLIE